MTVYETELPGVGRKFEIDLEDAGRIVVIVHHDGRREIFRRGSPEADSDRLFDLSAQQARQLATVLQGSAFQTVDVDALEAPIGEAILEWVEIGTDSPLAGQSLGETHLRRETGVSVIAVQRGESTVANPDSAFSIEPGDVLVTLGTREEHAVLADLLDEA